MDVGTEAWAMREAYLSLRLDPVEWAGNLNVTLESCEEDQPLGDEADLLRCDLALAAALVFAGRVQGV